MSAMFKTWTGSNDDPRSLAQSLEGHLNEYAEEVISVGYAIEGGQHHVLAVYRAVEANGDRQMEAAVELVEGILEEAQS
jgi:hypothetical protein